MLESDSDADMSGEELPASVADEEGEEEESEDEAEEEAGDDEDEEGSDPEEAAIWKVRCHSSSTKPYLYADHHRP